MSPDNQKLPEPVRSEDVATSLDAGPVPDPEGDRNKDQHRALRDD